MMAASACFDRLEITSPWMNAAGFLGFSPTSKPQGSVSMGAFVTNPVSITPRKPAVHRMAQPYPGGTLIHTGLPNPGLQSVLKQHAEKWSKLPTPVWVHVLPQSPDEIPRLIEPLEFLENVSAVELGIPPGISLRSILDFIRAGAGELPLMVCIGVDEIQIEWMQPILDAGAAGLVLTAPRGILKTGDHLTRGRLYGPAVLPHMFKNVCRLAQFDLPLVASGGVFSLQDGDALLSAGACAVQVDTALWSLTTF